VRFFPFTSSEKAGWPASILLGEREVVLGAGLLMYPPQEGKIAVEKTSSQKSSQDFPRKSITPESVGRSRRRKRNRREY